MEQCDDETMPSKFKGYRIVEFYINNLLLHLVLLNCSDWENVKAVSSLTQTNKTVN